MWEYQQNVSEDYLAHHGILGMHWGVRRFQNKDGTLTPEGRKRAMNDVEKNRKEAKDQIELYGGKNAAASQIRMQAEAKKRTVEGRAFVASVAGLGLAAAGLGAFLGGFGAGSAAMTTAGIVGYTAGGAAITLAQRGSYDAQTAMELHALDKISYITDNEDMADVIVKNVRGK